MKKILFSILLATLVLGCTEQRIATTVAPSYWNMDPFWYGSPFWFNRPFYPYYGFGSRVYVVPRPNTIVTPHYTPRQGPINRPYSAPRQNSVVPPSTAPRSNSAPIRRFR